MWFYSYCGAVFGEITAWNFSCSSVTRNCSRMVLCDIVIVCTDAQVNPTKGEALRTRFVFSTDAADDSLADYPLLYKYGYRISDQEKIHMFSMSNVDLQAATTLPAGKLLLLLYKVKKKKK